MGGGHRTILSLSVCSDSRNSRSGSVSGPFIFTRIFFWETLIAYRNSTSVFVPKALTPEFQGCCSCSDGKHWRCASLLCPKPLPPLAFLISVNGPPSPLCLKAIIFDPFLLLTSSPIQSFPKSFLVYSVKCLYVFKLFLESFVHANSPAM